MATHRLDKAITKTWEITKPGDTWILGEDGRITGDITYGIETMGSIDDATVRIDGEIDVTNPSGSSTGIYLDSEKATISINTTGRILGADTAIQYNNGAGTFSIDNDGLLRGFDGINSWAYRNSSVIHNDGTIRVAHTGITAGGAGARIFNSGMVRGEAGIDVNDGVIDPLFDPLLAENATHIVNTGKISGSHYALWAGGVAVNIRNRGTLSGDVWMGDGDDVFNTAGGTFKGVLYGGDGDDVVTLASPATLYVENANEGYDTVRINSTYRLGANVDNLTLLGKGDHVGIGNSLGNRIIGNKGDNGLYGLDGNDLIWGVAGRDRLFGGDGADMLDGGKGNDTLTGGADADDFQFFSGYGRDTIADFDPGADHIYLVDFADIADFTDIQLLMTQPGDDTILRFSDKDVLILRDVNMGDLTASDFGIFA
jgi:Ca2+-binding RTX toxin-like protein